MESNDENVNGSNIIKNLRQEVGFHKSFIAFDRKVFEERMPSAALKSLLTQPAVPHFAWEGGSVADILFALNTSIKVTTELKAEIVGLRGEVLNLSSELDAEKAARVKDSNAQAAQIAEIHRTLEKMTRLKRSVGQYVVRAEGADVHGLPDEVDMTQNSTNQRIGVDDLDIDDFCDIIDDLDPSLTLADVLQSHE